MTRRGPRAELVEFEGCGHAPALMDEAQIAVVHEWLMSFDDTAEEGEEDDGEPEIGGQRDGGDTD